jgi:hypothetical protein
MAWHDCGWKGLKTKPGPKPQPVKTDTKTKEGKTK